MILELLMRVWVRQVLGDVIFLKDHINKFKIDGIILNSYYNFVSLFGQDSTFITENCNN